jgi:iron complex transport system substrate-binding protein
MEEKWYWILAVSLLSLGIGGGAAADFTVPGDLDGDLVVSPQELEAAEEQEKEGKISAEDLEVIRHISENYPQRVVDSSGREVAIYKPLERIVILNSETVEVVRSLKAQDKIIGVGKYTQEDPAYFPELSKLPGIGSVWTPDIEAVLELHPEAVFIYGTFMKSSVDEIQETLEAADPNLVVLRVDCFVPESHEGEVEMLGLILEREEEAAEFLEFYRRALYPITAAVSGLDDSDKPTVYFESWVDFRTATQGAAWHEKLTMAGGNNIFGDLALSYTDVDPESIIERNPEIVVKLCGAGSKNFGGFDEDDDSEMAALKKEVAGRPGWDSIDAVKKDHVYVLSNDILGGAQHFIGVAYLAKLFCPELFDDLDPTALHQEYLERFQGLDLQGVYIYPELSA